MNNYLHDVPDGILVGGFSSDQGSVFPAGVRYEAKNVLVQGNMVVDAWKHALNAYGAVDSLILNNSLANVSKVSVINATTDNLGYVSKGLQFVDNILSKNYWTTKDGSVSVFSGNGLTGDFDHSQLGPGAVKGYIPIDHRCMIGRTAPPTAGYSKAAPVPTTSSGRPATTISTAVPASTGWRAARATISTSWGPSWMS